jgi:hypothetical protein
LELVLAQEEEDGKRRAGGSRMEGIDWLLGFRRRPPKFNAVDLPRPGLTAPQCLAVINKEEHSRTTLETAHVSPPNRPHSSVGTIRSMIEAKDDE